MKAKLIAFLPLLLLSSCGRGDGEEAITYVHFYYSGVYNFTSIKMYYDMPLIEYVGDMALVYDPWGQNFETLLLPTSECEIFTGTKCVCEKKYGDYAHGRPQSQKLKDYYEGKLLTYEQ